MAAANPTTGVAQWTCAVKQSYLYLHVWAQRLLPWNGTIWVLTGSNCDGYGEWHNMSADRIQLWWLWWMAQYECWQDPIVMVMVNGTIWVLTGSNCDGYGEWHNMSANRIQLWWLWWMAQYECWLDPIVMVMVNGTIWVLIGSICDGYGEWHNMSADRIQLWWFISSDKQCFVFPLVKGIIIPLSKLDANIKSAAHPGRYRSMSITA